MVYDPANNSVNSLGLNGNGMRSYRTDLNNVAPRVGLAFRPTERFVFRAGYGIHYFALPFALTPFNPATIGTQVGITGGLGTTAFTVTPEVASSNASDRTRPTTACFAAT